MKLLPILILLVALMGIPSIADAQRGASGVRKLKSHSSNSCRSRNCRSSYNKPSRPSQSYREVKASTTYKGVPDYSGTVTAEEAAESVILSAEPSIPSVNPPKGYGQDTLDKIDKWVNSADVVTVEVDKVTDDRNPYYDPNQAYPSYIDVAPPRLVREAPIPAPPIPEKKVTQKAPTKACKTGR